MLIWHPVDWSGRHEDSCGRTGQGRPRRRLSAEEAPRTARGKRSARNGNQQTKFNTAKQIKGSPWLPNLQNYQFNKRFLLQSYNFYGLQQSADPILSHDNYP
jgi:hypothetical protein